jgi:hypothetical protein
MTELIESSTDRRIPVELVTTEQTAAFASAFNALILRGLAEDDALEEAFAAAITPEQRAAAMGEDSLYIPE